MEAGKTFSGCSSLSELVLKRSSEEQMNVQRLQRADLVELDTNVSEL